ncbi:hypothetical protein BDQ12DRAFT_686176 [Crucibulum laeve]|uniref:Uncharacterized protein n=1 Tax=Crucibulum laeve TaxID=68775 RepID=A0A5C3LX54_9AGAR|nr:hypothetical protein BDQ12DRAFT_686176 [Crucibulum laeve]
MWAHLSRVLDLQSQIARMHVDMEGIGLGKPGDTKGKGKGKNGIGMGKPPGREGPKMRPRQASTLSQFEADGEHEGDEEGVGMADEEAEKNKAREDEFAKLADQFEGRKESIADIMNRVRRVNALIFMY